MRKRVCIVALLLALTTQPTSTQIIIALTEARRKNHRKMNALIEQYNRRAVRFNRSFGGKDEWQVDDDEASDAVAEIGLRLNEMYYILTHYDEEEP